MSSRSTRERWNPDSVLLLALMAIAGTGSLLAGVEPDSVTALVPRWMAFLWGVVLTGGAAVTLAGVLRRDQLLEAAGRIALAPSTLAYVVALLAVGAATRGTVLVAMLVAITLGSLWRLWQIYRQARDVRRALAAIDREGDA